MDLSIVTGAASGIGAAVAQQLAREHHVLGLDRDVPDVDASDAAAGTDGEQGPAGRIEPRRFDVTREDDWSGLAAELEERPERLVSVVHNAGTAVIAAIPDTTPDRFRGVLETNLVSVFLGTRALWRSLTTDRTSVVCVASVAAVVGQDAASGYVASKGGLVALVRELAVELAPHGARVNAVSPGSTSTPLLERHFASLPDGEEARARLVARQPLGRLMEPSDIAPVIVFLCSEGSVGMNGANVVVDGGLTATFDYGTSFAGGRG